MDRHFRPRSSSATTFHPHTRACLKRESLSIGTSGIFHVSLHSFPAPGSGLPYELHFCCRLR